MLLRNAQINKLNVEDLAGMMPKGGDSDEAASLFPMVVELKSKVEQIRGVQHHYVHRYCIHMCI